MRSVLHHLKFQMGQSNISVIDEGPNKNVLTPEGIKLMQQVHRVINKGISEGIKFSDICYRYVYEKRSGLKRKILLTYL